LVTTLEPKMTDDPRCCGSGTCIIDPDGRCWCGQQWNGEKMAAPAGATRRSNAAAAERQAPSEASGPSSDEGAA
jgi:hypothetical protein